jgi:acyl-CoA thioesterase
MTPFDDAITLQPQPDGSFLGRTHPGYANMVGPYGGITAAQALNAVLQHPARQGEPVALTVNYCAALADGEYTALARPARTNRSTQHWTVELSQQGQAVVTATVFTALRRDTWAADEHRMPAVPAPEQVPPSVPPTRGRVAWLERYEMRFIEGQLPDIWDGGEHHDSRTQLWMRDAPARPLDHASLTALADVFFPRIWRRRAKPVPVGTVSMTVYFHADPARLRGAGSGFVLGQAQAQGFFGGYFDQTAQLWSEGGELLATTHQVVYYKE